MIYDLFTEENKLTFFCNEMSTFIMTAHEENITSSKDSPAVNTDHMLGASP